MTRQQIHSMSTRFPAIILLLFYCWAVVVVVVVVVVVMTPGTMIPVVAAWNTAAATVAADTLLVNGGGGLRNGKKKESSFPRTSVSRRLYGPENGQVRKHIRLLEEQSQRSQTGFLGDPNHKVPYYHHPYDPESPTFVGKQQQQWRQLQEDGDSTVENPTTSGADLFKPLRIKFSTDALDSLRSDETAAKIDFIKTQVLTA
jgi:hypothetical protein